MTKKAIADDNPALDFITIPGQMEMNEAGEVKEAPAESQKPAATAKEEQEEEEQTSETKTARFQLVLKPSMLEDLRQKAWENHKSVNAYIESLLEKEFYGK